MYLIVSRETYLNIGERSLTDKSKTNGDFMDKWRNSSMGVTSLFLLEMSTIVTLCSMTVSFLVMLFSSGEDGYRLCFF